MADHISVVQGPFEEPFVELGRENRFRAACSACPWAVSTVDEDGALRRAEGHFDDMDLDGRLALIDERLEVLA